MFQVTKSHSYIDADVEKDIECKVHTNEMVRFYCEPCEICICNPLHIPRSVIFERGLNWKMCLNFW